MIHSQKVILAILLIFFLISSPMSSPSWAKDDHAADLFKKQEAKKTTVLDALEEKENLKPFCENHVKKFQCRDLYVNDEKFKLDDAYITEVTQSILADAKKYNPQVTEETLKAHIERQFQDGQYCMQSSTMSKKEFRKRTLDLYQVEVGNSKAGWEVVSRTKNTRISKTKNGGASSADVITGIYCNDQATYSCEMLHKQKQKELESKAIRAEVMGQDGFYIGELTSEFKKMKAEKIGDLIDAEKNISTVTYSNRTHSFKSDYSKWLKKIVTEVKERDPSCKSECANSKDQNMCYKMYIGKRIQRKFDDGTFCEGKLWSPKEIKEYILTNF